MLFLVMFINNNIIIENTNTNTIHNTITIQTGIVHYPS
jgi:hypothetical protein